MEKPEPVIYGIKTGDTYHYIGKTNKRVVKNGNINKSDIHAIYVRNRLRNLVAGNDNISIEHIKNTQENEWYDEKLSEVVAKHHAKNPLLNAQWMLEGKRGYWEDKTRDQHTLQRLSESKYVRIAQYDADGDFVKMWSSVKEVATLVFNDYKVKNGGGCSYLYKILSYSNVKNRFRYNSYWFKESELYKHFNCIPKKIHLNSIIENQRKTKIANRNSYPPPTHRKKYTVIHYNPDMTVKCIYNNVNEAAFILKTSTNIIKRIIGGLTKNDNYILKYGQKTLQPICPIYKYEKQPLLKDHKSTINKLPKEPKVLRRCTRTRSTVNWYINNELMKTFDSVLDASKYFKVSTQIIRRVALGKKSSFKYDLKFGDKKQIML